MRRCSLIKRKATRILVMMGLVSSIELVAMPAALAQQVSVLLPSEQVTLTYPNSIRLEKVFTDVLANAPATSPIEYPLANRLFNLDKQAQIEELKRQVITQLDTQHKDGKSKNSLIQQVKTWQVGFREELNLDFDVIRTQAEANPMLSGNFELIASKRSPTISIEGLVGTPQTLTFDADTPLRSYIEEADTLSNIHPSYAWIIYPDGRFLRVGYALWNEEYVQIPPNSVIFLGFNSDSATSIELEEKIVKLITMRKYMQ